MENTQDFITTELTKYNLPDAKIAEMKSTFLPIKVKSVDDMDNYLACKEAHQEVRKVRIAIENKRKELKASSLMFGRAIDTEAKRLTVGVSEVEDHLYAQRRVVEDEKKRIEDENARIEMEKHERLRREEEQRLEKQRKEQETKERELREKEEKIEAEKKKMAEEKERIWIEKKEAEEAEKHAEQEKKDATEREKRHAEEVKKAEEEAVRKEQKRKEEEENAKIEATRRAEAEAEHAKLMAPDKDKILAYKVTLMKLPAPVVKTEEARVIVQEAVSSLVVIIDTLQEKASKL